MKKNTIIGAIIAPTLLATAVFAQSSAGVNSLRGVAVDDPVAVEDVFHQQEGRFSRNYRQQPPLVPHSIDQYQIDMKANRCLSCHDWTVAGERRAPTLSMTHYLDRNGAQLDVVSGTRWFCNQCHVPQADAPELVDNTFAPSN